MTKAPEIIACPACGTELTLEHLVGHLDDERAFARLVALSVPMAHLVVQYIALFAPEKQRLTLRKKVRLIQQLLPDLQRQAITHKGRDWPAPLYAWEKGIEQMLAARTTERLQLPMTGHGYLYAILAGLADKHEAAAEQQREQDQRLRPQRDTVQVKGQTMAIGDALEVVYGGKDPALVAIAERDRQAAPMPADVRARLDALRGKGGKA
ncbi:hypothetical protein [Acidovorax sp. BLS4]|uniref:hypothetical protein n=1 Tax=Acidovorax sp. BLS4 TaxID=3273430 RepID=UPI002942BAF3|nr:hypothetical protein [Paracidovorax avenae]WOI47714.1 hypothetical protein R1Z03_11075 [Paracidovorax avenae]